MDEEQAALVKAGRRVDLTRFGVGLDVGGQVQQKSRRVLGLGTWVSGGPLQIN